MNTSGESDENGPNIAESAQDWRRWCRLCAKHDPVGNVSVFFKDEQTSFSNNIVTALAAAIGNYFLVNITPDEPLPKVLCPECYTLITSLVNFSERVVKVQNMFDLLEKSSNDTKMDLHEIRSKFGLLDEDREHVLESGQLQQNQQLMPEVHYLESKPKINELDEQPFEELNTVGNGCNANPLANTTTIVPKGKLLIKKENVIEMDEVQAANITSCEDLQDPFNNTDMNEATEDGSESEPESITSLKQQRLSKRTRRTTPKTKLIDEEIDCNSIHRCTECPRKFKRFNHFELHMKRTHSKDAKIPVTLQCQECQQEFRTDKQLQSHALVHLPPDQQKTLPCPFCEKKFAKHKHVQSHIKHIHMNERPFICEECGFTVRTNGALKTHMLTHTDYSPFECKVCQKGFKNKARLRKHLETHDPNKHTCAECGLQLNSRSTLNRHLLVHSDEMQHKCDYCGRAFKRAKTLKNHLILHMGLKPYSCDFCDRTFASGSNCRSHKKKAHPEELAAMEAAGGHTYTRNIPKLEALKAVTKNSNNLAPVVSKQSGCFSFGKKPKPMGKTASPIVDKQQDASLIIVQQQQAISRPESGPLNMASLQVDHSNASSSSNFYNPIGQNMQNSYI